MSLGLASVLFGSLCCPSFYFTCSLYRFAWVSILSDFLCHLMSPPVCIGLYVVRVSMSLGLTPVLYGSLCCPSFYVTWSHSRSVWVSMLSEFLCDLVSLRYVWFSMFSRFLCHLISLPFCMGLYFVRFSMSLNFTSILYIHLLSEFPSHLLSLSFCMVLYVVRVSVLVFFHLYVRHCVNYYGRSFLFSSPCQRQCKHLPSLGVRGPLTFHISIFSSEIPQPNEVKLGS